NSKLTTRIFCNDLLTFVHAGRSGGNPKFQHACSGTRPDSMLESGRYHFQPSHCSRRMIPYTKNSNFLSVSRYGWTAYLQCCLHTSGEALSTIAPWAGLPGERETQPFLLVPSAVLGTRYTAI